MQDKKFHRRRNFSNTACAIIEDKLSFIAGKQLFTINYKQNYQNKQVGTLITKTIFQRKMYHILYHILYFEKLTNDYAVGAGSTQ